MDSCVGYAWRYLEMRGKQNAQAAPPRQQTFIMESDEDDDSLLRFMKEVEPSKELIPPQSHFANARQIHVRRSQSGRPMGGDSPAIAQQISRQQMRQSTDAAMTANAFSDLDAIAEMGAGGEEHETQQFSGQNTPCLMGNFEADSSAQAQTMPSAHFGMFQHQQSQGFDPRRVHQQHQMGMAFQQQQFLQMSPIEQQQQRFALYKQQQHQQKQQFPGNTAATYRFMQGQASAQSGAEIFDFDDSSNFGTSPYHSPTGNGPRRRGRGRRGGGNIGDRQPSISSLENESTPGSPSIEYPTAGKRRGSGQRKPRRSKKQESFEQQQQQYFPSNDSHGQQYSCPQQQQTMSGNLVNYNPAVPTEEEVRNRLVSEYERGVLESSSSDEEMDPPPPPRNLQMEFHEKQREEKVEAQSAKTTPKPSTHQQEIQPNDANHLDTKNIGGIKNEQEQQQTMVLHEMKLACESPASFSSSPALNAQQQQQSSDDFQTAKNADPKNLRLKVEEEQQLPKNSSESKKSSAQRAEKLAYSDLYDNQIGSRTKNEMLEKDKKLSATKNPKEGKNPKVEEGTKESRKKSSAGEKKPAKIVLKIKPPREGAVHLPTKNSSSSSPSSTSSSMSASTSSTTLAQSADQAMARLSGSAAPPSKSKHQQHSGQQKGAVKRAAADAPEEGSKQKKSRKSSPIRPTGSTSSSSQLKATKLGKDSKTDKKQRGPELPAALSQIAPSTFPSLKNFKIPKVVETETAAPQSSAPAGNQQKQTEQQIQSSGARGEVRKYSDGGPHSHHNNSDYRRHADKFHGHGKGGSSWDRSGNSFNSHHQNRQRKPDKRGGGGHPPSHGADGGGRNRKYGPSSNMADPRPRTGPGTSRASGGFQREMANAQPNAIFPAQQNWNHFGQQQFTNFAVAEPQKAGPWMPTLSNPMRFPSQHQQQEQQNQMANHMLYRPMEETNDQQQVFQFGQPQERMGNTTRLTVEDRNDNSPSGDGLQIVDEE